jgi:glycine cleavage system H protein
MEYPNDRKYTKDHEWVMIEGDTAVVGITQFAQSELGDLVFVDLPPPGKNVKQKDTLCVVESTKAASDVYAPIGGTVLSVNDTVKEKPETVNSAPHKDGWLVKLAKIDAGEVSSLLSAEEYKKLVGA